MFDFLIEADKKEIIASNLMPYEELPTTCYVIDLETTGKDDEYRLEILTLSLSLVDRKKVIDEIELTFRPGTNYWEEEAEKIHGISKFQAARLDEPDESTDKLLEFIHRNGRHVLMCHALKFKSYFDCVALLNHFDKRGLRYEYNKYFKQNQSTINWMRLLRKRGFIQPESMKLKSLCNYFNIPLDHHNSKSDREATQQLFWIVCSYLN